MPHFDRYGFRPLVAAVGFVLAVTALAVGYVIAPDGFIGNVLAELFGIGIGTAGTVLVIDWLLARERLRRMQTVGYITKTLIREHIVDIMSQFTIVYHPLSHLIGVGVEGRSQFSAETSNAMKRIVEEGQRQAKNWRRWDPRGHKGPNSYAIELREKLAWDNRQILERYFPLVLDHLDNPPLAEALAKLNQKEHNWQNQIIVEQEVVAGDPYGASLEFLEAAHVVYDLLKD